MIPKLFVLNDITVVLLPYPKNAFKVFKNTFFNYQVICKCDLCGYQFIMNSKFPLAYITSNLCLSEIVTQLQLSVPCQNQQAVI